MSADRGDILLAIARAELSRAFGVRHEADEDFPWLQAPGASFVTLTQHGDLRGCIGTLEAHRPLLQDIKANVLASAFHDPRFSPLQEFELPHTAVEVSLLAPPQAMTFRDEKDALAQLRPGVDGLILQFGHRRSTFLPQVWEQLPDPRQFMAHLKYKAGLPTDFWSPDFQLARYTVDKWKE
jgi:AmmeMemoRadiSam system protein A